MGRPFAVLMPRCPVCDAAAPFTEWRLRRLSAQRCCLRYRLPLSAPKPPRRRLGRCACLLSVGGSHWLSAGLRIHCLHTHQWLAAMGSVAR